MDARIIAQAADEGIATALAKSVVVTTTNGAVTASPNDGVCLCTA